MPFFVVLCQSPGFEKKCDKLILLKALEELIKQVRGKLLQFYEDECILIKRTDVRQKTNR